MTTLDEPNAVDEHPDGEQLADDAAAQRDAGRRRQRILERRQEWFHDPWDDPDATDGLVLERARPSGRRLKTLVFTFGALLIVAALAVGVLGLWYLGKVNPAGKPAVARSFTVEANDTLQTVSERLEQQGFITSAGVFRWYVDHHDGLKLTPGYYQIRPDDHMGNVMLSLGTPPYDTYRQVTFPEGYSIKNMAKRVNETMPRLSVDSFIKAATDGRVRSAYSPPGQPSLEGLLFPDTYQVSNAESSAQVVIRMVTLMERVGRQENIDDRAAALYRTPYEVLIVASMIEREAKFDVDRPKIARVIYNRLARDMPLQIDATLFYGQDPNATFADVRNLDTVYNTYLHTGLPPTPIANPGRASIEAALSPAANPSPNDALCKGLAEKDCQYLFYVKIDEEGHHAFSATLAQQEKNIDAARAAGVIG